MNKTKRKGFTLVELLAVIVILAVVILIAVTAVIPRMNKARENAFVDEALVYMKAAKEAYISNETIECYDIEDMDDYVKQSKSGYSGTVYVNEKGVSLNITNGKYYIKTSDKPTSNSIVETKPTDFISSCSEDDKTYTILYDLDGGTVSGNPTSYNQNTPTITLNNPTKSGYRFVGWSSKNLFNKNTVTAGREISTDGAFSNNRKWYTSDYIPVKSGSTYYFSGKEAGKKYNLYDSNKNFISQQYIGSINGATSIPINVRYIMINGILEELDNAQMEEGSSATDFQEYMDPTKAAKIYRGSTGNKKFIANWGPLVYHVTLDNQGATEGGTPEVYYEINKVRSINGVVCYYYSDSEVTKCIRNGYYIDLPIKTGYTFGGYYTEPNGQGTQYVDVNGSFVNNIYQKSGDRTLYAKWIAN